MTFSFFDLEVSNLIANVTVAFALAVLLTYSLVGLADTGPGEGIQLAGGFSLCHWLPDIDNIGFDFNVPDVSETFWNSWNCVKLWIFDVFEWTCNVSIVIWDIRWHDLLYVRSQLDGFCWNCRILLWMHQFCHPNVRRPWQQGNVYPDSGSSGAKWQGIFWCFVIIYVCEGLKVSHWSTLIRMNEYL